MQANKIVGAVGLIGALCFGSWWIAQAMVAGNTGALLLRFVLIVITGLYYLALYRDRLFQPHRYR